MPAIATVIEIKPPAAVPEASALRAGISKRTLSRLIADSTVVARKQGAANLPMKTDHPLIGFARGAHLLPRSCNQAQH